MGAQRKSIQLKSYAKVNLCLDVKGLLEGGYHEVEMILQQILLCDEVALRWEMEEEMEELTISLGTNRPYLPRDQRNLAWRAAEYMARTYAPQLRGKLRIDIKKRIPVAAGLAGGSSNCAAVIHGVNQLWHLGLSLEELCRAGAALGSDVPFCVMGQAAEDPVLKQVFPGHPLATHCAIARGTGTDLVPIRGLRSDLVLSKPAISVSTAEVYQGIDTVEIPRHPDIPAMQQALVSGDLEEVSRNLINVLENFTLKAYPIVVYTKNKMQELCNPDRVMMSGSGPSVFGLCDSREEAKRICRHMQTINRESFWTRTTFG